MRRCCGLLPALLLLASPPALASVGGIEFGLQYGYGGWSFDQAHLAAQLAPQPNVGPATAAAYAQDFADHLQNGQAATLRLGYNILGFGGPEAELTATGWNITNSDRGGGGLVGGALAFSPMNFFLNPHRRWDAQIFGGYGYGLVGQTKALSGGVADFGLRAAFFITQSLSIGANAHFYQPSFSSFILDYDNRSAPGNTLPLPQGSGGQFWMVSVQLGFVIPVGFEEDFWAARAKKAEEPAPTPAPAEPAPAPAPSPEPTEAPAAEPAPTPAPAEAAPEPAPAPVEQAAPVTRKKKKRKKKAAPPPSDSSSASP